MFIFPLIGLFVSSGIPHIVLNTSDLNVGLPIAIRTNRHKRDVSRIDKQKKRVVN